MAEESSGRKKVILICVLLVLAISPLVLLSSPCLRVFENRALPRPGSPGSPGLLFRIAWVYRMTFRPQDAKRAYGEFYDRFPSHPKAIDAHWRQVLLVKETDSRQRTREVLDVFVAMWRNHPRYAREFEQEVQKVWLYTKRL